MIAVNEPRRLDDSLARMAKWEELRRRADAAAGRAPGDTAPAAPPPAGHAAPLTAVDDLIQTLRDLATRQPSLSVAVIAQEAGVTWRMHTVRADGRVQVVAARAEAHLGLEHESHPAPPLPPAPVRSAEPAPPADSAIAARLADMLRTNPTMLEE